MYQNVFFFWHKHENHGQIRKQLKKLDRPDLETRLLGATASKGNATKVDSDKSQKPMPDWLNERRKKGKKKRR